LDLGDVLGPVVDVLAGGVSRVAGQARVEAPERLCDSGCLEERDDGKAKLERWSGALVLLLLPAAIFAESLAPPFGHGNSE